VIFKKFQLDKNQFDKSIYVVGSGRCGTTLLLRLLGQHPKIVVRSLFPYETRASQYYYLFKEKNIPQNKLFEPIKDFENNNEYIPFQGDDIYSKKWAKQVYKDKYKGVLFSGLTESYYEWVAHIEKKSKAIFFAEKAIGIKLIKRIIAAHNNSYVFFLKRDPRDIFFSIKSFNKKRGFKAFGEQEGEKVMFANIIKFYIEAQKFVLTNNKSIVCHYEDIITDPHTAIRNIFSSLKIEPNNDMLNKIVKNAFKDNSHTIFHKTSNLNSVSRWKNEAGHDDIILFSKYNNEIETLGYIP